MPDTNSPDTGENPFVKPDANGTSPATSIIDTILDLDEMLSADVRRAEKTARFATKPWLEAEIDELEFELEQLTDGQGNPLDRAPAGDDALSDGPPEAVRVAERIREVQAEYAASFRSVRVQQMPADEWMAFENKHRKALDKGAPYPEAMWDELISKCAIAPEMAIPQIQALRKKLGHPQVHEIAMTSWEVCTASGVSVPKSRRSSHVLKQRKPETN